MSVAYSQSILGTSNFGFIGTPTATSSSFSPAAGDAVLVLGYDDVNNGRTLTFGGTGSYSNLASQLSGSIAIGGNGLATSGSQTFTVTTSFSEHVLAMGLDYSGSASITGSMINRGSPGLNDDDIQGTSVAVPSGGMLVALCINRSFPSGNTLEIGSSATNRASGRLNNTYPYLWEEYAGTGANILPTFTDHTGGGTNSYSVGQWVITASGGGGAPSPSAVNLRFVMP